MAKYGIFLFGILIVSITIGSSTLASEPLGGQYSFSCTFTNASPGSCVGGGLGSNPANVTGQAFKVTGTAEGAAINGGSFSLCLGGPSVGTTCQGPYPANGLNKTQNIPASNQTKYRWASIQYAVNSSGNNGDNATVGMQAYGRVVDNLSITANPATINQGNQSTITWLIVAGFAVMERLSTTRPYACIPTVALSP